MMRYLVAKIENTNQCSLLKENYVFKIVLQKINIKNDESNSNINIFKILHLPFDMLCYFIESITIPYKMHCQSDSPL